VEEAVETLANGKHLRLLRRRGWEYVERCDIAGVVAIVALTAEQQLVLVEQYRPPVGSNVIELPAGLAGDSPQTDGEPLERAARRELWEETGFRAGSMRCLFTGPSSAGLSSEQLTFFLTLDARREGAGGGDAGEQITVHTVALEQVPAWLDRQAAQGRAIDLKIYAGLFAAHNALKQDVHE
jgi:ADP-ribose pyrophosphatase